MDEYTSTSAILENMGEMEEGREGCGEREREKERDVHTYIKEPT